MPPLPPPRRVLTLRDIFCGLILLHLLVVPLVFYGQVQDVAPDPRRPVHVAVCFFGLTRSLRYTIDSIRSNILDELTVAGINYTIYLHTHNVTRVYNPRAKEFNVRINPALYRLLRPDHAVVNEPVDWSSSRNQDLLAALLKHGDPWNETEHISLKNLVGQLNSLQTLTSLWWPRAAQYDAVIYLRSDVWFFNKLNVTQVLQAAAAGPDTPVIWTPVFHQFGGLNDRFAFGNPRAMYVYGNRLQQAQRFSQARPLHSETFLQHVLARHNVTCFNTSIVFTRIRGDGLVVELPMKEGGQLSTSNVRPVFAYRMVRTSLGYWRLRPA